MIKKLFATTYSAHSTFVRWRKEVADGNTFFTSTRGSGFCVGATIVWLKKSIASNGKGVKSADELGDVHWMAIVHAAYAMLPLDEGVSEIEAFPSYLSYQNLPVLEPCCGSGMFDPRFVVEWVSGTPGHYIFAFSNKTNNLGHVVGIRFDGKVLEMFDPSLGAYEYSDTISFIQHLMKFSFEYYTKGSGSEWGIFRVE